VPIILFRFRHRSNDCSFFPAGRVLECIPAVAARREDNVREFSGPWYTRDEFKVSSKGSKGCSGTLGDEP